MEELLREAFQLGQQWVQDINNDKEPIDFNTWYKSKREERGFVIDRTLGREIGFIGPGLNRDSLAMMIAGSPLLSTPPPSPMVFEITKPFELPRLDESKYLSEYNHQKHVQTCTKNRKKRKSKKKGKR